jgi:hypothetical protein
MPKFSIGDMVIMTENRDKGHIGIVYANRGGRVAPYQVKMLDNNELTYRSGRDMELQTMGGKKKMYCCEGCGTYSFVDKGTVMWRCYKHNDCTDEPDTEVSLAEKVDMILEHLGLEIVVEPRKPTLVSSTKE